MKFPTAINPGSNTNLLISALDYMPTILGLMNIETNIKYYKEKKNDKKVQEYENIQGNIENTFEPFANCIDLVRIYQQKFDLDPENVELIRK